MQWAEFAEKAHGEEQDEATQHQERERWTDLEDEANSATRDEAELEGRIPRL